MKKKDNLKNEIRAAIIANSNIRSVFAFPGLRITSAKKLPQAVILPLNMPNFNTTNGNSV